MRETVNIEQLWYTWSTTGLDAIPAGIRVRAASPGLMDINSQRMRTLDRYLRYSLPVGTNLLAVNPQQAPICLAFLRGDQGERILAHKVYTGKDGRNRPGNYFIHLLAGLPETFSAQDAIALWRSPSWQTADVPAHEQGTRLRELSLNTFRSSPALTTWNNVDTHKMDQYLPHFIQAYLLQRDSIEKAPLREKLQREIADLQKRTKDRRNKDLLALQQALSKNEQLLQSLPSQKFQRIYLAASADEAAYLLSCLFSILPQQWLADLTFSTYEQDVLVKHDCVIVNTCLPPATSEAGSQTQEVLPAICYEELALNCYTGHVSLPYDIDYAVDYADYAADVLATQNREDLDSFLYDMENINSLQVEVFLQDFNATITQKVYTPEEIEKIYRRTDQAIRLMKTPKFRSAVRSTVIQDPQWFQKTLKPLIADLYRQSKLNTPVAASLARVLNNFAQQALKEPIISSVVLGEQASFDALFMLTECIAPPLEHPTFWTEILSAITNHIAAKSILSNWNIRQLLMPIARQVLVIDKHLAIIDALLTCTEQEFPHLLMLRLPDTWNCRAAELFDKTTPNGLHPDTIALLAQSTQYVTQLITHLVNSPQHRNTALSLFTKLANGRYKALDQLYDPWWRQDATSYELNELIRIGGPALNTCEELMKRYGNHYLQKSDTQQIIIHLFRQIVPNPDKKLSLLFSLLKPQVSQNVLEQLLTSAQLSNDDAISFLQRFPEYPARYPTANIWVHMLTNFVPGRYNERKWQLLSNCLNAIQQQQYTPAFDQPLERLLQAAQLNRDEAWRFFESYGKYFIPFCYQSPFARHLYQSSVKGASSDKVLKMLMHWFSVPNGLLQGNMEWLLATSSLIPSDEATLLEHYGRTHLKYYPHSPILLEYVGRYLDAFDLAIDHQKGSHRYTFLEALNNNTELPDTLRPHAQIIFKIVTLAQQGSFTQNDITELGQVLLDSLSTKREQLQKPVAQALACCIKDAIQLGPILVPFFYIFRSDPSYTDGILLFMAQQVQALAERKDSNTGVRIAAYLQLLFYGDAVYTMQEEQRKKILDILLTPRTPIQILKVISDVAATWPATLRAKWHNELHKRFSLTVGPDGQLTQQDSGLAHMQAIPTTTINAQTRISPLSKALLYVRSTVQIILEIPLALLLALLLFITSQRKGTGPLAAFWSQHHALLTRHRHLISEQSWKKLQFAVIFQKRCTLADDATPSIEAERQIIQHVNDKQNEPYLPKWTLHENVRIALARERIRPPQVQAQQPAQLPYVQPHPISNASTISRAQPPIQHYGK